MAHRNTQKGDAEDNGQRIVQAPTGNTLMKHRHLTKLEWKLVSLPYWTWNEVSKWDNEAQRQFWLAELSYDDTRCAHALHQGPALRHEDQWQWVLEHRWSAFP